MNEIHLATHSVFHPSTAAHASDSESLAPDEDFLSTQSPRKKPSKAPRPYPRHPRHGYDDMRPATDNSTPGATPDHPVYSMLLGEGQRKRYTLDCNFTATSSMHVCKGC